MEPSETKQTNRPMMTFEIKSKVNRQGRRAGSTLYYAYPTKRPKLELKEVERRISESCSLSAPDVRAALVAFAEIVCASFQEGIGVDLGEMGTLMPFTQGRLMDSPEEVTTDTLQPPKVILHPKKNIQTALGKIHYRIKR